MDKEKIGNNDPINASGMGSLVECSNVSLDLTGNNVTPVSVQVEKKMGMSSRFFDGYDNLVMYVRELLLLELITKEQAVTIRGEIGRRIHLDINSRKPQ